MIPAHDKAILISSQDLLFSKNNCVTTVTLKVTLYDELQNTIWRWERADLNSWKLTYQAVHSHSTGVALRSSSQSQDISNLEGLWPSGISMNSRSTHSLPSPRLEVLKAAVLVIEILHFSSRCILNNSVTVN